MEDVCQPNSSESFHTSTPKDLQQPCDKCCAEQREVNQIDDVVNTTCIKYQRGNYSDVDKMCWCLSDFTKNCRVNICQPAVENLDGTPVLLTTDVMEKASTNCDTCCKAMVVPNIGILLDHPTYFKKGFFKVSDRKCWCKWSFESQSGQL